ncbi:hypothetical protein [Mucilaginibacter psychrotolerans]|uniref:Uncharacterized protein n=1 Tax=Mucilaginibacter psychrotolerans TaxID=1524096 RepID=A0A4Y8S8U5_9SPHI|nr:hypothetical protein [Mucilaginibacter psychrotolerans]TFF35040.1 hypothetical protein E2R66_20060 [Mucilaginibacter psychrotolerans]
MKKIMISLSLLLLSAAGFAQAPLKPVKIDSLVTVSLPETFSKKDTLGQQIYSGNSNLGYMVVIRQPNAANNTPLKKERDLNQVMKDYIKGIKGQAAGSDALNVRDTTMGHLKAKTFTLSTDQGGGVQLRNFILLYTQDVTYTFEYFYQQNRAELVKDEYKQFSSAIVISPELKRTDQYLSNAKGIAPGLIYGVIGGVAFIGIIIFYITRRNRKLKEQFES